MVEIALPKNSKITSGKTWPSPSGATKTEEFRIYRFNPEGGHNPRARASAPLHAGSWRAQS